MKKEDAGYVGLAAMGTALVGGGLVRDVKNQATKIEAANTYTSQVQATKEPTQAKLAQNTFNETLTAFTENKKNNANAERLGTFMALYGATNLGVNWSERRKKKCAAYESDPLPSK